MSLPDLCFAFLSTKRSAELVDQAPAKKLKVGAAASMQSRAGVRTSLVHAPATAGQAIKEGAIVPLGAVGEEGTGVGKAAGVLVDAERTSGITEPRVEEQATGPVAALAPLEVESAPSGSQEVATAEQ